MSWHVAAARKERFCSTFNSALLTFEKAALRALGLEGLVSKCCRRRRNGSRAATLPPGFRVYHPRTRGTVRLIPTLTELQTRMSALGLETWQRIGRPPGNYDRLLDFSRAVTGTLFFVPATTFLENVATREAVTSTAGPALSDGSIRSHRK